MSEQIEKQNNSLLKIVLPVLVLLAGAGAAAALIMSRTPPERQSKPTLGPLVEAIHVQPHSFQVKVEGQGEVGARTRVEVLPEVSGRVVKVHRSLVAGGRIAAGETLVEVDPRDYQLAVESARATIASVETRLEQEQAEAEAALLEWREVHGNSEPPKLLIREPQVRQLEAEKAAAQAQLARAELDLERTRLSLPFDGVVQSENVDRGQFLSQGRAVATVYGTDAVEIRVPLDDSELRWFELPKNGQGPAATVSADFGGERHSWPGQAERLEGEVDPRTRQIHLVVRVNNPFDTDDRPPLLPGAFVDVAIDGRPLENVLRIPRYALRQGGVVWTVVDNTLRLEKAEVLRSDRQFAYIRADSSDGATVVTSALEGVTDGMVVRVSEQAASKESV